MAVTEGLWRAYLEMSMADGGVGVWIVTEGFALPRIATPPLPRFDPLRILVVTHRLLLY
jgi:hypothetical protein